MTDKGQFDSRTPSPEGSRLDCAAVELHLAEWAEGGLNDAERVRMEAHVAACPACREELEQARRGREWMLLLKEDAPPVPARLLERILAITQDPGAPHASASRPRGSTAAAGSTLSQTANAPVWQKNSVVVLRRTLFEPRLALVAAMAFFSITLTLNLMGVRLRALQLSDFTPAGMRRAITRQYVQADSRVVRYYENLRLVYEVEARVQQLKHATETAPSAAPAPQPEKHEPQHDHSERFQPGSGQTGDIPAGRQAKKQHEPSAQPATPAPISYGCAMDVMLRITPGSGLTAQEPAIDSPFPNGLQERRFA
jgi:hypothetical protein